MVLSYLKGIADVVFRQATNYGQGPLTSLSNITGGILSMAGPNAVYNRVTGELFGIGQQGPLQANKLNDGTVELVTQTLPQSLNSYRPVPAGYDPDQPLQVGQRISQSQVSATIDIRLTDGSEALQRIDAAQVGPVGGRIIAQLRDDGGWNYESTKYDNYPTNAELQAKLGPLVRYATPTEAAAFAIKGELIGRAGDLISRVRKAGGAGGLTLPEATSTTALDLLFSIATQSMQTEVVHQVRIY